jgi:hypothetical protein
VARLLAQPAEPEARRVRSFAGATVVWGVVMASGAALGVANLWWFPVPAQPQPVTATAVDAAGGLHRGQGKAGSRSWRRQAFFIKNCITYTITRYGNDIMTLYVTHF